MIQSSSCTAQHLLDAHWTRSVVHHGSSDKGWVHDLASCHYFSSVLSYFLFICLWSSSSSRNRESIVGKCIQRHSFPLDISAAQLSPVSNYAICDVWEKPLFNTTSTLSASLLFFATCLSAIVWKACARARTSNPIVHIFYHYYYQQLWKQFPQIEMGPLGVWRFNGKLFQTIIFVSHTTDWKCRKVMIEWWPRGKK